MALKQILGLGILLIDIFLVLVIISVIGFKKFGLFFCYYMAGLITFSIIFGLIGYLDEKDWKKAYKKNQLKVKWFRLSAVPFFIIAGLLAIYFLPRFLLIISLFSAFIVVSYLVFICKDFLYILSTMNQAIDSLLLKRFKWIRK